MADILSFRTMNIYVYIAGTLFVYCGAATIAVFVEDLGPVFEIFAAVSKTSINFIWPGLFYLVAAKRYGDHTTNHFGRKVDRAVAIILIGAGVCVFSLVLTTNLIDIVNKSKQE